MGVGQVASQEREGLLLSLELGGGIRGVGEVILPPQLIIIMGHGAGWGGLGKGKENGNDEGVE